MNGTLRYQQRMAMEEANNTILTNDYQIPDRIIVMEEPMDANETVPFRVQPRLLAVDKFNKPVMIPGHKYFEKW